MLKSIRQAFGFFWDTPRTVALALFYLLLSMVIRVAIYFDPETVGSDVLYLDFFVFSVAYATCTISASLATTKFHRSVRGSAGMFGIGFVGFAFIIPLIYLLFPLLENLVIYLVTGEIRVSAAYSVLAYGCHTLVMLPFSTVIYKFKYAFVIYYFILIFVNVVIRILNRLIEGFSLVGIDEGIITLVGAGLALVGLIIALALSPLVKKLDGADNPWNKATKAN